MRFYYENISGDSGHFTLKKTEIPKAIMSAWNIEAELYIVADKIDKCKKVIILIFAPYEGNEVNNEWLKDYGLYLKDGDGFRELHYIADDSLAWKPDNWEGILQLI
ncbi:hypothetical protein GKG47_09295 [Lactonifactor sp. BIOML-A3]|uniref:hypothetical protein n=1 Tax=unclassified Lactonifactor TaxID=2636670 RepID=UPI0012B13362|nr:MULTISPECIES: hypothetical protein [unclassified Lactonifactor]MSA02232.1 hypothetical protein [Lactonifactor sp. BIOML-A5]MSA08016.1 hypothetical protein [Lactonifactor sp. BIOML-A4]MSA12632.1 hypothetical protein [Lactonifactor sp. BIOML-A3]MSA16666.1 hypothetical protein [Lactonifactor sp. BIOML-A2]MSA37635.1 hypothetical protein [Lactonifactor sp. BIOML-A1]